MIGNMAGYCHIHKIDKMFVGTEDATEPTCVRCKADATPKLGRTQLVEDPGENFNGFVGGRARVTVLKDVKTTSSNSSLPLVESLRLEDVIGTAVAQLKRLPMPEDIKQFKTVQKAIKTLESLVEKSNG